MLYKNDGNNIYLNAWNSYKIRVHRTTSKAYKLAVLYFKKIQKGQFLNFIDNPSAFLENCKIDSNLLNKPLSEKEILDTIHNLSLLFKIDYWPRDKSKLPKSLVDLIYNSFTNYSFFFMYYNNSPKLMKGEEVNLKFLSFSKEILDNYTNIFDTILTSNETRRLIFIIEEIINYHKNQINWDGIRKSVNRNSYSLTLGSVLLGPDVFLNSYLNYLRHIYFNGNYVYRSPEQIRVQSKLFNSFRKYLKDNYEFII